MASLLAALALLAPLTLSAGIGKADALQLPKERQAAGSLEWFKPGLNCTKREESCLGTIAWCSNQEYYSQIGGYKDQNACFSARMGKTEWRYMNTDCFASFEQCDGTDVVCSRVENPGVRGICYESHTKGRWLEPYSQGCLAPGKADDERCVGTRVFCEARERVKSYGSAQYCRENRESASSNPTAVKKHEFLAKNDLWCFGDATEKCIGTETFCARLPMGERQRCFDSRGNPPFYVESSPDCQTSSDKGFYSEACLGTEQWCQNNERVRMYGSSEKCMDYRRRAPGSGKWFPPNHACPERISQTEQCAGTEQICQFHSPRRDACFEGRELGPFLLANPNGCPEVGQQGEHCLGTDVWCHDMYSENNYFNQEECFSRRGFNQHKLAADIAKVATAVTRQAVLKFAENVTRHAVYYNLIGQRGNDKTAMKAVKTYLDGYLTRLQEGVPEITRNFMLKVEKKALGN